MATETDDEAFTDPFGLGDLGEQNDDPHVNCVPDYAYQRVCDELARVKWDLQRAREANERLAYLGKENDRLNEMYAAITNMCLEGPQGSVYIHASTATGTKEYVVSLQHLGEPISEFVAVRTMLLDAWEAAKKAAGTEAAITTGFPVEM